MAHSTRRYYSIISPPWATLEHSRGLMNTSIRWPGLTQILIKYNFYRDEKERIDFSLHKKLKDRIPTPAFGGSSFTNNRFMLRSIAFEKKLPIRWCSAAMISSTERLLLLHSCSLCSPCSARLIAKMDFIIKKPWTLLTFFFFFYLIIVLPFLWY
jgi:hypothetical protein